MPCQTQTSQQPQQPTTVLPQNLPKTQADWQRFLQRMNELLGSINNAQYATGVNAVPTEYAVYDGTALPALRITGATSAFDTAHAQFGVGSLKLTATASTVTVELASSGYPITLHPNWKWIASLFLLTSAASITGKLSVVTPAQQYDVDISGSPGASWSRLYGDYDLTADASTSCTLLLTLTGVTIGQVFNVEGWMLEPSQGAVLPSPFIMTSGPRTWNQVVGSDAVNTSISTAQTTASTANTTANTANTTANNAQPAAIVNPGFDQGIYGWTPDTGMTMWYAETGTAGPNGGTTSYMVHGPSDPVPTGYLNNAYYAAVVPGQIIKATCKIRGLSGSNGSGAVRLLWQDSNLANISSTVGNLIAGGTSGVSVAMGAAPSNAAFVRIGPGVGSHTAGYFTFDDLAWNYQPSTLDEVPNSATYLKSLARAQGLVENGDFEIGDATTFPPPGWRPGSYVVGGNYTAPAYETSAQYAGNRSFYFTAPQFVGLESTRSYPVNPGDYYAIGGALFGASSAALYGLYFLNASNANVGSPITIRSPASGWGYATATGKVPAGAVSAVLVIANFNAGSIAVEFDALFMARCPGYDNTLSIAGSGQRVGDQRNLLQRTVTNYPSKVSPGVSYSASAGSPATATISVAAFTALLGSVSVSYNASSASVTGTNGTNVNYYLYFNDPTYSGGTKTLVATTNQNDLYSGDGYVYVGYVTVAFPSSGSGSGGGTGCPLRTAWVIRRGRHGRPQHVRAGKVRVGDWLLRTDGEWAEVTFSRAELQPCVRLVADGFGTLGCSVSAPMQLRDGSALSIACLAREVVVSRNGTRGHAVVTDLHDLGAQWVQHITLANAPDDFFWTGDAKDALFGHHNAKPP